MNKEQIHIGEVVGDEWGIKDELLCIEMMAKFDIVKSAYRKPPKASLASLFSKESDRPQKPRYFKVSYRITTLGLLAMTDEQLGQHIKGLISQLETNIKERGLE